MKLSLKDIKAKLNAPRKIIKAAPENFDNFMVGEINLEPYKITDEVWLIPDYISEELEEKILNNGVYHQPDNKWVKLRTRNLQLWGGDVTESGLENQEPLPKFLDIFAQRLFDERIFPYKPNHALINEYQPGQGIMPHTDGPAYYPLVATLCLGSIAVSQFWNIEPRSPAFSIILPQRSMLLWTGNPYYNMLHSIEDVPSDYIFTDSCGIYYTQTSAGELSRVLNYTGPSEPIDQLIKECPECKGDLKVVSSLYRETRVSITIRYVPLANR